MSKQCYLLFFSAWKEEEPAARLSDDRSTGVGFFTFLVKCCLRDLKAGQLTGSVCFPKVGLEDLEMTFFSVLIV